MCRICKRWTFILGMRQNSRYKIKWLETGLSCARKIHDRATEKDFADKLGQVYSLVGEADRAAKYHGQCLSVARNLRDRSSERTALCGLGRAYFSLGKAYTGAKSLQRAIKVARKSQDRIRKREHCGASGESMRTPTSIRSADCYQQALQIAEEIGMRIWKRTYWKVWPGIGYPSRIKVRRSISFINHLSSSNLANQDHAGPVLFGVSARHISDGKEAKSN